jgi:hypothetical protein
MDLLWLRAIYQRGRRRKNSTTVSFFGIWQLPARQPSGVSGTLWLAPVLRIADAIRHPGENGCRKSDMIGLIVLKAN